MITIHLCQIVFNAQKRDNGYFSVIPFSIIAPIDPVFITPLAPTTESAVPISLKILVTGLLLFKFLQR